MADFAYALHTEACTYLLDASGVCLWVLSPDPKTAAIVQACVGAHFVASLDARVKGSLTSELVPGASALFATLSKDSGRPILLRTGPVLRVQLRSAEAELAMAPLPGQKPRYDGVEQPPASDRSGGQRARKKSEGRKPPPLPRQPPTLPPSVTTQPRGVGKWIGPVRDSAPTTKRRLDPEESSITLVTYPGVPVRGSSGRQEPEALVRSVADDAAPLLLKNKRKKRS